MYTEVLEVQNILSQLSLTLKNHSQHILFSLLLTEFLWELTCLRLTQYFCSMFVCVWNMHTDVLEVQNILSKLTHTLKKSFSSYTVFCAVCVTMIKWWGVTRSRYILQMFPFSCRVRICVNYISRRSLSKNNNKNVCEKIRARYITVTHRFLPKWRWARSTLYFYSVFICVWDVYTEVPEVQNILSQLTLTLKKSFSTCTYCFFVNIFLNPKPVARCGQLRPSYISVYCTMVLIICTILRMTYNNFFTYHQHNN